MTRERTEVAYKRLCEVIPAGVSSAARAFPGLDMTPMVVREGRGDTLIDVDGKEYIDYCCSWGPLIHGHAHPEIVQAVQSQVARGTTFGITTELEEQLARKIGEMMPSIEQLRFVSSGTEATMTAVRLARGFTGRTKIIKFEGCYHGHADALMEGPSERVLILPYNDVEAVSRLPDDLAAVVIEPIAGNMGVVPASPEFLATLRRETERVGALLIFDEVITGFRVAKGGAQELYGIKPDLTCLGKIMGGGFPMAAFGGSREIMQHIAPLGPVYQAGTLSGNPVAAVAALKTLELLDQPGFYEELDRKTDLLLGPLKETGLCINRVGSMFTIFHGVDRVENFADAKKADLEAFKRFFVSLFEGGIYIPPSQFEACFISAVHTDAHLQQTVIGVRPAFLRFGSRRVPSSFCTKTQERRPDPICPDIAPSLS